MKKTFYILGVLLALTALARGAWYFARGNAPSSAATAANAASADAASAAPAPGFATSSAADANLPVTGPLAPPRQAPAGQHEYRNAQYRFALFSPDDLSIKSYDEGGGAATFVFQDIKTAHGFQAFIVPYTGSQVSMERFWQDEPSGAMQSPLNVTVGGVPATSFYSSDTTLGPTAEVWFLHGGYLFEVTAPKSEAAWLSTIMQAWEFI